MPRSRIIAQGMLRQFTPVEDYREEYGLWVKREDRACLEPGPQFSKTRGVYAHISKLKQNLVGVLDTSHSQAGHAVARACQILGKKCVNYYPEYKYEPGPKKPQLAATALGAELVGLPAGRSAILFHQARKDCEGQGGYMMPNALKLIESVEETAKEVFDVQYKRVIIPISSGTIAAGVILGYLEQFPEALEEVEFIIHLGYSRSHDQVRKYLEAKSGFAANLTLVDEGYAYKDVARKGLTPPWPCNEYYDLKAFRWWVKNATDFQLDQRNLFWNVG